MRRREYGHKIHVNTIYGTYVESHFGPPHRIGLLNFSLRKAQQTVGEKYVKRV